MTTDISIYNSFPTSDELKNLQLIAVTAFKSGLYKGSSDAIIMTLLSARELNIGPMMALNGGINNINGKVELSARLMAALIRRGGHTIRVLESTASKCTLQGVRADTKDLVETSFTVEESKKAGIYKAGGGWDKWPEDMCYARALTRLARRLFPDVIGNCYVEGEISGEDKKDKQPEGLQMAEVEFIEPTQPESPSEPVKPIDAIQANELNNLFVLLNKEDRIKLIDWMIKLFSADSIEKLPESEYERVLLILKKKTEVKSETA